MFSHLDEFQKYFRTNLKELKNKKTLNQNEWIEQGHFGDFICEVVKPSENQALKLIKSHADNIKQGEANISILHWNAATGFDWKILYNEF